MYPTGLGSRLKGLPNSATSNNKKTIHLHESSRSHILVNLSLEKVYIEVFCNHRAVHDSINNSIAIVIKKLGCSSVLNVA